MQCDGWMDSRLAGRQLDRSRQTAGRAEERLLLLGWRGKLHRDQESGFTLLDVQSRGGNEPRCCYRHHERNIKKRQTRLAKSHRGKGES